MHTYTGLLDDVVQRYEPSIGQDHTFFSRNLAKHALFGQKLLINDGYIFAGSGFEQALSEDSMLRGMMRSGFVKLLTKLKEFDAQAFSELPEKLATQGVNTSQELTSKVEWETDIKPNLMKLGLNISKHRSHAPFPEFQMDAGFRKIFDRVQGKTVVDLGIDGMTQVEFDDLIGRVRENETYLTAPRTVLEEELLHLERSRLLSRSVTRQLMAIGCQAYHYNFALCLSASTKEHVSAETSLGRAFEDLLDLPDAVEADVMEPPSHNVISMPKRFPYERFDLFESFIEEGHEMHTAKMEFLGGIEETIKQRIRNEFDARRALNELSDMYRRKMVEHFTKKGVVSDDVAPHWYRLGSVGVTFIVGKFQGDWAVASELPSFFKPIVAENPRVEAFVSKMHKGLVGARDWQVKMLLKEGMDPKSAISKSVDLSVHDIVPRYSSIGFNEAAVEKHTDNLPVFEA